ncbi:MULTISPECIES: MerR family transcriptional regulator [Aerococcus]|uniref:MerR family transcriptional regulator n=2 Tax=Aerococcus TaxID=1375 RepID=A0A5N1GKJ0_9LACT|nr:MULTISPECIES: MerR family transcriptional regulator [Aerococcus]KAA9300531.1 MerR family transcriptional regulator [Aerococcus sanguinicola]MDK6370165.1 MerR family transcriptional regulator [Aerococcus sp. UMB9870]MDK6680289.1 MerR family transcriptional regulator [Aerococcus sp. UMB8608]MDK6686869.1 MerR family transcriptional regulator [Aerococcus sp. UMB8623]MDK6939980.1 MerR family transcriptional regulator [Aerococcus sp. UMB8487]
MKTVNEVSKLAGVTAKTLYHYDKIGLLKPSQYSEAGYRLYSDEDLERLQQILLFRELRFSLKEIKGIIDHPSFDKQLALDQQIQLLELEKERLERLILFAKEVKLLGVKAMNDEVFNRQAIDDYARQAKELWGSTAAFKEFEVKNRGRTQEESKELEEKMMDIFKAFGQHKEADPQAADVQLLIEHLQDFISNHFYQCSDDMLVNLGQLYAGGGDISITIDKEAGDGTAAFVNRAIELYCQ